MVGAKLDFFMGTTGMSHEASVFIIDEADSLKTHTSGRTRILQGDGAWVGSAAALRAHPAIRAGQFSV